MDSESNDKETAGELPPQLTSEDRVEAKIDRNLRDSFPASDPPGWTLGVERHDAEQKGDDAGDASSDELEGKNK